MSTQRLHELPRKRQVYIIESTLNGHHDKYLAEIARGALAREYCVEIWLPDLFDCEPSASRFKELGCRLQYYSHPKQSGNGTLRHLLSSVQLWLQYKKNINLIKSRELHEDDIIIFPYFDAVIYGAVLLGFPKVSCPMLFIRMRVSAESYFSSVPFPLTLMMRMIDRRISKPGTVEFVLDPRLAHLDAAPAAIAGRRVFLRDPAEALFESRLTLNNSILHGKSAHDDGYILVCGALDDRKGIYELITSVHALHNRGVWWGWKIILAGKQSSQIRNLLSSDSARKLIAAGLIVVRDEYISDTEMLELVGRCTLVWVAYKDHVHMSGVMALASRNSKPIIGCKKGLIGWYCDVIGVGVTTDLTLESTNAALLRLRDPNIRLEYGQVGLRTFKNHGWDNFCSTIFE